MNNHSISKINMSAFKKIGALLAHVTTAEEEKVLKV